MRTWPSTEDIRTTYHSVATGGVRIVVNERCYPTTLSLWIGDLAAVLC